MYEYLIGNIVNITTNYIVIEVNNIGYKVYVANPSRYVKNNQKKVYIYQSVRENNITLYGFCDFKEKQLFIKLINVSGIGPKSALTILAANNISGLVKAIQDNDEQYLTQFPSVGKKTAKQIILDLKNNMSDIKLEDDFIDNANNVDVSNDLNDALDAMISLGYSVTEVKKISAKLKNYKANNTDEYLKKALKLALNKNKD